MLTENYNRPLVPLQESIMYGCFKSDKYMGTDLSMVWCFVYAYRSFFLSDGCYEFRLFRYKLSFPVDFDVRSLDKYWFWLLKNSGLTNVCWINSVIT